jgi:hypothetical protein
MLKALEGAGYDWVRITLVAQFANEGRRPERGPSSRPSTSQRETPQFIQAGSRLQVAEVLEATRELQQLRKLEAHLLSLLSEGSRLSGKSSRPVEGHAGKFRRSAGKSISNKANTAKDTDTDDNHVDQEKWSGAGSLTRPESSRAAVLYLL